MSAGSGTGLRPLLIVNMDLLVIDLGDAAAAVGDPVELLGAHAHLDDLAAAAGTVAHEVLVGLSRRAERRYLQRQVEITPGPPMPATQLDKAPIRTARRKATARLTAK